MPSCPPCLTPCWADCLSPASQHPDSLAPFPPCCSKSGCVTQQGKHPRNRPRASLLPPHPPAALPSLPWCRLGPSPAPLHPARHRSWGVPPAPRKDPPTNTGVSSGVHQPSPKCPRARTLPHLGHEGMEGPWLTAQPATSPPDRWCFEGELPSLPSAEPQHFVLSPGLSSQAFKALPKPKLILLQQLPSCAV